MSNDIRTTNPTGNDIFAALSFSPAPAQQETAPSEPANNAYTSNDNQHTGSVATGEVPANNIDLSDLPPLLEYSKPQPEPVNNQPVDFNSQGGNLQPLSQIEAQNQLNNIPDNLPDLFNGGPVNNPDELPAFNDINQLPRYVGTPPDVETERRSEHANQKVVYHAYQALVPKGMQAIATKTITRSAQKEVTKALTKVVEEAAAKSVTKAAGTIGSRVAEGTAKGVEVMIQTLGKQGMLGKGIITPTIKEISRAEGNIIKGLAASAKGARDIATKAVTQHGVAKAIPKTLGKVATGAGEKALSHGLAKGSEAAVKEVLEKAGAEVTEKLAGKAVETAAVKATAEAGVKTASKGSVKVASKFAKIAPHIGTAIGTGITIWDGVDAWKKTKDPNVSVASKALAWTTVGLDAVSTVSMATGKGKPFGWAATGLSIGTSFLSEYLR